MSGFSFGDMRDQLFPPPPMFTEKDVPSQAGRVFTVTGGNSGVRFELCKMLYNTGATVYMVSRSQVIVFLPFDLKDLKSVKAAAAAFAEREPRLNVLWKNARMGAYRIDVDVGTKTAQGLEAMVGNWMLGREFARCHGGDGILSATVNPGNIKAGSYDGMPTVLRFFMNRLLHETEFGAYTQLYA